MNWLEFEIDDAIKRYESFSKVKKKHFKRIRKSVYEKTNSCLGRNEK